MTRYYLGHAGIYLLRRFVEKEGVSQRERARDAINRLAEHQATSGDVERLRSVGEAAGLDWATLFWPNSVVRLTGHTESETFPEVGDAVTEKHYWHYLEIVPPACMHSDLLQVGEPNDHRGEGGRARYPTFQRHRGVWIYTGPQEHGTRVRIE